MDQSSDLFAFDTDSPFYSDPFPQNNDPAIIDNFQDSNPEDHHHHNPVDETNLNELVGGLFSSSPPTPLSYQPENFSLCQTITHLQNANSYPPTQFPDSSALEAKTEEFRQVAFQPARFESRLVKSPKFLPRSGNSLFTGQLKGLCNVGESQVAPHLYNIQRTQTSNAQRSLMEDHEVVEDRQTERICPRIQKKKRKEEEEEDEDDNDLSMNCGGNTVLPNPNVLLSPNLAKVSPTKKVQQQSRNFTRDEDILLISVCLDMDTVQGNLNQQKSSTYWKKIHDRFHEHRKFNSIRSQDSLKHRWSRIKDDVEKFSEYYAKIEGRQQNDIPERDKIFQALKLYEKKRGRPFQLQYCWQKLRDHPKWTQDPSKKNPEISKNVSSTMSSPSIADPIHLGEDDTANDESANLERPIDRKAQKREYESSPCTRQHPINLREDDTGNDSVNLERSVVRMAPKKEFVSSRPTAMFSEEYAERMHERLERLHRQLEEIINLEKEAFQCYRLREERQIMAIDTTRMEQKQAEYYESLKREIITKRNGTIFR